MTYETLLFDVQEHVAHITLNRPQAANTITEQMTRDLMNAVLHCDEDPEIRAVMISSSGEIFSGGGDLNAFAAAGERLPSMIKEATIYFHGAISRLTRMDPPVIAAVHGMVAGGGLSIACACDLVIAAEDTQFYLAYTRAGLTPDGSLSYFLPRTVGLKRALDLALTNRVLSTREALDWGIVSRIVPRRELLSQARAVAAQLAAGPTLALGATKRLLRSGWTETLETQMEHESQSISKIVQTQDAKEGITAFLEKRPPKFKGK
jgi:2-(1,2-epoxy-1,2-dihydrophenyl)acetyl-CoA isomerase